MKWISGLKLRFENQVQTWNEKPGNEKLNSRFRPEKKLLKKKKKKKKIVDKNCLKNSLKKFVEKIRHVKAYSQMGSIESKKPWF